MKHAARIACIAGCLLLLPAGTLYGGKKRPTTAKEQLAFGVKMASRGLWSEALFRFEQADRLQPNEAEILNNIAVAHEALGLFEEALEYYQRALELDPSHKGVRRNYARFVEFYQSFKPPEPEEEAEAAGEEEKPETTGDSA